ncbi:hypothetical protein ACLB2K_034573 [Fragaria x ananassa]
MGKKWWAIGVAVAILGTVREVSKQYGWDKDVLIKVFSELSDRLGIWAIPLYVAIHTLTLALCLPYAVFFEAAASMLFGFFPAVLCVFAAKLLGASLSFWVGRISVKCIDIMDEDDDPDLESGTSLGIMNMIGTRLIYEQHCSFDPAFFILSEMHSNTMDEDDDPDLESSSSLSFMNMMRAMDWVQKNKYFAVLSRGVERDGWRFVLLARFSPMPSYIINYALAGTKVRFLVDFLLPTVIGCMPMILQNTSIGSLAGAAVSSGAGSQKSKVWSYLFPLLGIISSILISLRIKKYSTEKLVTESSPIPSEHSQDSNNSNDSNNKDLKKGQ